MIAGLMHTILFSSAFVYLISTIKRRKIQLYIILGIVACSVYLYPNEEALLMSLVNFLEIVGYENYAGWIYNDSTSTWAKVLAVGGACFISFIKNKKVLWIFMTITIVFLVLSLNPLFAGRVYTLYIGAIVPMFLSQVQRIKYQTKIILISAYIFEIYILFFSDDVLLDLKLLFA